MKITNLTNLPAPIVNAVQSDYKATKDKFSITTLEKGVREILLARRHEDELESDVSDMIWALLGQLMHTVLEQSQEGDNQLKEEYLTVEIPLYKGGFLKSGQKFDNKEDEKIVKKYYISGRFDLYDYNKQQVIDYKLTTVWSYVLGGKSEWKDQLAGYGWMLRSIGFPVTSAQNILIFRDWRQSEFFRDPAKYPAKSCYVIDYKYTDADFDKAYDRLIDALTEIVKYENTPDDELPVCSPEQRWEKPAVYKVMSKGRKTSHRNLPTREEAEQWMQDNNKGEYIVEVLGESTKCLRYCSCCQFCNYWKEFVNVPEEDKQDEN